MTVAFNLDISVKDNSKVFNNEWNLDKDLRGEMSLEDMITHFRVNHIKIARVALKDEQSRGFDPDPRVRVDNKFDQSELKLKPFGKIEYFAKVFAPKVILDLYSEIEKRSPKRSGIYAKHNYVFYNSRLVARNLGELKAFLESKVDTGFGNSDNIRIMNVTPYGARLEYKGTATKTTGKMKGKIRSKGRFTFSKGAGKQIKKPNGAYFLASRSFSRKFRAIGRIKFEFIPNGFAGIFVKSSSRFRNSYINSPKNRNKKRVGKPYVYPSILITLSDKGVILN